MILLLLRGVEWILVTPDSQGYRALTLSFLQFGKCINSLPPSKFLFWTWFYARRNGVGDNTEITKKRSMLNVKNVSWQWLMKVSRRRSWHQRAPGNEGRSWSQPSLFWAWTSTAWKVLGEFPTVARGEQESLGWEHTPCSSPPTPPGLHPDAHPSQKDACWNESGSPSGPSCKQFWGDDDVSLYLYPSVAQCWE